VDFLVEAAVVVEAAAGKSELLQQFQIYFWYTARTKNGDKMAKAKEHAKRFGVVLLTVLFLVTSVGFSVLVIWETRQKSKNEAAQVAAEKERQENMIQGTPLQNFTPVADVPQLQIIDTVVGTGAEVKAGDTITAHYTGAVAATGIIFQSSHDRGEPVQFSLSEVIAGWTEGVPGMKVGGTRRLLIPSDKAYGANPPEGIPVDADLVFDIELVSIP